MSNLTRPTVDLLLNTLSEDDFGHVLEGDVTTGAKTLILKKQGFSFVGANTKAVIKLAAPGQKMKRVLTLDWKWYNQTKQMFEMDITREVLFSSIIEDQQWRTVHYNFLMNNFTTTSIGTLETADKKAIIDGLAAQINADVQLNINAIMTGAVVVATNVNNQLVLEAKETGTLFTARTFENQFTQATQPVVGYMKDKLSNDEVARIFSIKPEDAGFRPNVPIKDVDYACITFITKTQFVGLSLPGGQGEVVEQRLNVYTPVSELSKLISDKYTANGDNAKAMGTGSTPDSNLVELLEFVFGSGSTNLDQITTAAIGGVTAPVKAATPVTTVTATAEYTGVVAWKETVSGAAAGATFAASTAYTAVITLTPKTGKTLIGVNANFFTVAGGSSAATNPVNSGVVTVAFAATGA